jgi:hypothetical protein
MNHQILIKLNIMEVDILKENDILKYRIEYTYTDKEKEIMKKEKNITTDYLGISELNGITILYENQINIAKEIVNMLLNRTITNIMVLAKTQSGKTGSMCATIKIYLENNLIPIENIYIITGLSSCEWKEQTKKRIPDNIEKRVFHRDDLDRKLLDELKNKTNVIIFMDEIQVAAKQGQTINSIFKKAGFLDIQFLYQNDIKILEYTATPDGTIYDLMNWKYGSAKILADAGEKYTSSYDLFLQGRVKQFKDLCGFDNKTKKINSIVYDNIKEIKTDIDNYNNPLYHIIRTKSGDESTITINNFHKVFNNGQYEFINYDENSNINDINKILSIKPIKHTIIFIKEKLRCAKTLIQTYKGVSVERFAKNIDDAVIIQGLVGRDTGYTNNGFSICYTNIDSIVKYEKLWRSKFEDDSVNWNSKTTKFKFNILCGGKTFNDALQYNFEEQLSVDILEENSNEIVYKCESLDIMKQYVKSKKIKWFKGEIRKPDKNGFYHTSIYGGNYKIYSCDEIKKNIKNIKAHLNKDNYRLIPCYEDIKDKFTLSWWIIHF